MINKILFKLYCHTDAAVKLVKVIFAFFGFTTMLEGTGLLFGDGASLRWVESIAVAAVFLLLCIWTLWKQKKKAQ